MSKKCEKFDDCHNTLRKETVGGIEFSYCMHDQPVLSMESFERYTCFISCQEAVEKKISQLVDPPVIILGQRTVNSNSAFNRVQKRLEELHRNRYEK